MIILTSIFAFVFFFFFFVLFYPNSFKPELHGRKVIVCVWWDHSDIIHFVSLNCNQTLNIDLYSQQVRAQSAGAIEYIGCFSAEGWPHQRVLDMTLNNMMVKLQ